MDLSPLQDSAAALEYGADVRVCVHAAGPPLCWCRLPLPGLGVQLADHHHLDAARTTVIGRSAAERTFSRRMGWQFLTVEERRA